MIEAIFTIVGTIVGFLLSELATLIRDKRHKKKQVTSVKTILKLEIASNLELLEEFWGRVGRSDEYDKLPLPKEIKLARQFIQVPLPTFKREAYESQLPFLPESATETEIVQVFHFYDHLGKIETMRKEMLMLAQEQQEELRAATRQESSFGGPGRPISYFPPTPFNDRAPALRDECEELITGLLSEGNPFL